MMGEAKSLERVRTGNEMDPRAYLARLSATAAHVGDKGTRRDDTVTPGHRLNLNPRVSGSGETDMPRTWRCWKERWVKTRQTASGRRQAADRTAM